MQVGSSFSLVFLAVHEIQPFLPNPRFILKRKTMLKKKQKKKRLSPHFITSTTWGQVVPVSTSGLSEDALWEKKFELAAGKKKDPAKAVEVHNEGF